MEGRLKCSSITKCGKAGEKQKWLCHCAASNTANDAAPSVPPVIRCHVMPLLKCMKNQSQIFAGVGGGRRLHTGRKNFVVSCSKVY